MNNNSATLLMPCLNEIEGIQKVLPKVKREWCDQIIILDGFSTDGTREWCKDNGYSVFLRTKPGLWEAYTEVFNSGIIKGDVVITFSPDGNSIPEAIPKLIHKINEGYDMVIASRYLGNATSEDDTKLTAFGNRLLTQLINLRGSFHYTDALVMFRAYRIELVRQLSLDKPLTHLQKLMTRLTGLYSWEPSLSIRANRAGLRIAEISASEPKAFRKRRQNTFIHGSVITTQIISEVLHL